MRAECVGISCAEGGDILYQLTAEGRSNHLLVQTTVSAQETDALTCFNSSETRLLKGMVKRLVSTLPVHTN